MELLEPLGNKLTHAVPRIARAIDGLVFLGEVGDDLGLELVVSQRKGFLDRLGE
jgi:hypothetical protein